MKLLETKNIGWKVSSQNILTDVSVQIQAGNMIGILGPNGAGKSTFLKLIAGTIAPSSGKILLKEKPLQKYSSRDRSRLISMMAQEHATDLSVTVQELVSLGRHPYTSLWGMLSNSDEQLIQTALDEAGLKDMADRTLMNLSGGERQRAYLALALAQQTEILLLDEPGTFLDLHWQHDLWSRLLGLCHKGKTVISVLHNLDIAKQVCDQVLLFHHGNLVKAGSPGEIINKTLLESIFDCPLAQTPDGGLQLAWRTPNK